VVVGVCRLTLLASHCHSLKEKRAVVRTIKDRTRRQFSVAVAEVGGHDTWQRAVLGLAVVGGDRKVVQSVMSRVVAFIEGLGLAEVAGDERETLVYGEGHMSGPDLDEDDSWVPDAWKEEG
jgi:uncharacterized protein